MSLRERLVRPDSKGKQRIPGCKAKKAGGCDHNGREVHAQVVSNQTAEQSRQPNHGHRARSNGKGIVARGDTP